MDAAKIKNTKFPKELPNTERGPQNPELNLYRYRLCITSLVVLSFTRLLISQPTPLAVFSFLCDSSSCLLFLKIKLVLSVKEKNENSRTINNTYSHYR